MKVKSRAKGFTLIEILVVIIILGVLAGIAVPTYNKLIRKSRVADGLHGLDVLAGAQEKYFIDHGFYAQDITRLNAPFKEYRTGEHNDIFTTNFTYIKPLRRNCIEAQSNRADYKLVKNYESKEKIVCIGEFCNNIIDYVSEMNEELYSSLCPINNNDTCTDPQPENIEGECGIMTYTCERDGSGNWNWVGHPSLNEGNECWDGQTRPKPGDPSITQVCVDCHWTECGEGVPQLQPLQADATGSINIKPCHTYNGVEDPDRYCGILKTDKQVCVNDNWIWDFSESICEAQEKPDEPFEITSDGCLKRPQEWKCYVGEWFPEASGNWAANGNVQVIIGEDAINHPHIINYPKDCTLDNGGFRIEGNRVLPLGGAAMTWCENCLTKTCPSGSVRNVNNGKCYTPSNHMFLLALNDFYIPSYEPNVCFNSMPFPASELLACRKDGSGNAVEENPGCPEPDNSSSYHYSCLINEGRTVERGECYAPLEYCKTAQNPTNILSCYDVEHHSAFGQAVTWDDHTHEARAKVKWCGLDYYFYCPPRILEETGNHLRTCDEVVSVIFQNI